MINILFKKYTATENEQREIKKQKKTLVKLKAMMTMSVTYPMLHNLQASSKYYVITLFPFCLIRIQWGKLELS